MGVWDGGDIIMTPVNFLNNGFGIFRVNSFDARQVTSIVEDQMQVTLATVMTDCLMP